MAMRFKIQFLQGLHGPSTMVVLDDEAASDPMAPALLIHADRRGVKIECGSDLFFDDPHDFQILAQAIGAAATAYQKKHKVKLTNAAGH